ncbi:hypothetical protein TNCT_282101 [Trichonephila clavata]|uniref:Uncharacterized protein n=1 Tax=Trichonephila clavata TaxID=2740835 RepID=A0A8X6KZW5_TRICU|nr:hypothetical protein TNCT_282101 [Trichonephila clavata]
MLHLFGDIKINFCLQAKKESNIDVHTARMLLLKQVLTVYIFFTTRVKNLSNVVLVGKVLLQKEILKYIQLSI